ncbi:hypothetical protein [Gottfriedia solisilvae]
MKDFNEYVSLIIHDEFAFATSVFCLLVCCGGFLADKIRNR